MELLNRFRIWMILKLGGYLDPGPTIRIIQKKEIPIEKFSVVSRIDYPCSRTLETYYKDDAMKQILKTIDQAGFVRWHIQHHPFSMGMSVEATMFVVNANNLDTWDYEFTRR